MSVLINLVSIMVFSGFSFAGFQYIGPGSSAGAIAAFLGILGAIVLGIFGTIYYPLKRKFSKKKPEISNDRENADG